MKKGIPILFNDAANSEEETQVGGEELEKQENRSRNGR